MTLLRIDNHRRWVALCLLVVMANLACSLLARPLAGESAQIQPTRTPLPTFTPTTEAQTLVIPPTATPAPLPTAPVEAAPAEAPLPEVQPTVVEPTPTIPVEESAAEVAPEANTEIEASPVEAEVPAPAPTEPPPPAQPEAPAEPGVGAHGVIGKISFREGRNTYGVGEKVFVKIEATNTQPGQMTFGILGLTTSTGAFQTSWSSGTIDGTFTHEDGLPFNAPGTHKIWLSICFSPEDVCKGADGDWERFEPGLDVVIQ